MTIKTCVLNFFFKIKLSKNYQKCFLFYKKSSFHSEDFQLFAFPTSPLFSFLGNCWFHRSCLMINPKVYDIKCLNWILKTQILFNTWQSKVLILIVFYREKSHGKISRNSRPLFIIYNQVLSCPKANFSLLNWQGDSIKHSWLITALCLI